MYSLALSWWAGFFLLLCLFSFGLASGPPLYTSCLLPGGPCIFLLLYISLFIHQKKKKKLMNYSVKKQFFLISKKQNTLKEREKQPKGSLKAYGKYAKGATREKQKGAKNPPSLNYTHPNQKII